MKKNALIHNKTAKKVFAYLQKIRMPGSKHVSMFVIIEFYLRNLNNKELGLRTAALSFNFFLALFPTVIFFFTLIAYLPFNYTVDEMIFFLSEILPSSAFYAINETMEDILKNQRGGLLSVGFISAIIFTTNGFHNLMNTLTRFEHNKVTRSFIKQRLVATILAVIISALIILSVLMVTIVNVSLSYLNKIKYFPGKSIPYLISTFNYAIVGLIILGVIGSIYYLAPNKKNRFKFLSPGALFSTVVSLLTTWGFSVYINYFNTYNKVYGSIGVLIFVMMLIYVNTYILLSGYELNIAISMAEAQELKNVKHKVKNSITYLPNVQEATAIKLDRE